MVHEIICRADNLIYHVVCKILRVLNIPRWLIEPSPLLKPPRNFVPNIRTILRWTEVFLNYIFLYRGNNSNPMVHFVENFLWKKFMIQYLFCSGLFFVRNCCSCEQCDLGAASLYALSLTCPQIKNCFKSTEEYRWRLWNLSRIMVNTSNATNWLKWHSRSSLQ